MKELPSFTQDELDVIDLFLNKNKPIREISKLKGYGRTKINNIIIKYASINEENEKQVNLKKMEYKNHKKVESVIELTEEDIENAYNDIIERKKSLTTVSSETGKHRDAIKRAILEYLGDKRKIREFEKLLEQNRTLRQGKYFNNEEFDSLNDEEKKSRIFNRLNARRRKFGKQVYSETLLNKKFNRILNFFEERNNQIDCKSDRISKSELLKMLYDYPTMLSTSLENKIKPIVDTLDNRILDYSKASHLLKHNPALLGSSLSRTTLQFKILKDSNTLEYIFEKPIILRTSPELMYALIKQWESEKGRGTPFLTIKKLYDEYSQTPGDLCKKYDVRTSYGDDEYFDGR